MLLASEQLLDPVVEGGMVRSGRIVVREVRDATPDPNGGFRLDPPMIPDGADRAFWRIVNCDTDTKAGDTREWQFKL